MRFASQSPGCKSTTGTGSSNKWTEADIAHLWSNIHLCKGQFEEEKSLPATGRSILDRAQLVWISTQDFSGEPRLMMVRSGWFGCPWKNALISAAGGVIPDSVVGRAEIASLRLNKYDTITNDKWYLPEGDSYPPGGRKRWNAIVSSGLDRRDELL